jgi:hypothetical protein
MAESSLWSYLKKNMQGYGHWVRIENSVGEGTPDVNACCNQNGFTIDAWIELKSVRAWPKRASTAVKIPHFTSEQKQWLLDRYQAGGAAFLFVRIEREYFLFTAPVAYIIDTMTREQWQQCARVHCKNRMDWNLFRRKLWR